ncbi:MAG TPA: hypothetical protein VEZ16_08485 [Microvirga sp.]|nr:hypothetical protein [Microvirga sp.]
MKAMTFPGRRPLFATAAVLVLSAAALLAQPMAAGAQEKLAAATATDRPIATPPSMARRTPR